MNAKNGYSLIEIAIGLAIITIFLVCTGSLINASYTNYRLILQRNDAMDFAIEEMENVLRSDNVTVSDVGYEKNEMEARVTIEKIKDGNRIYDDKVFLVTVNVMFHKTPKDPEVQSIKLQSLKVISKGAIE